MNLIKDKITVRLIKPNMSSWTVGLFTDNRQTLIKKVLMIVDYDGYQAHSILVETKKWLNNYENWSKL
jgi:hypothetical protein